MIIAVAHRLKATGSQVTGVTAWCYSKFTVHVLDSDTGYPNRKPDFFYISFDLKLNSNLKLARSVKFKFSSHSEIQIYIGKMALWEN